MKIRCVVLRLSSVAARKVPTPFIVSDCLLVLQRFPEYSRYVSPSVRNLIATPFSEE